MTLLLRIDVSHWAFGLTGLVLSWLLFQRLLKSDHGTDPLVPHLCFLGAVLVYTVAFFGWLIAVNYS